MPYSINSPNFFVLLSSRLEILHINKFITIFYFPGSDVINFEIYLIRLIKTKRQKFKYLKCEKNF